MKIPKPIHTMSGLEPRVSVTYRPDSSKVVGIAFSKTQQFLHLLSNSSVGLPTDVWLPANRLISPQKGYQSSVSYKQNFPEFSLSVEAYAKQSNGVIDFVDNADLFLNQYIETQVRTGRETAYGVETLLEKKTGKFTGWLTYTLAKTQRKIEGINNGNPYPTRYDRRHSLSLVSSYSITRNFYASLDFQYNSGGAVSLPGAVYQYQNATFNYYESKNAFRLPAFHRMDAQIGYQRTRKWGKEQFVVGLYNLYNRLNIFSIEVLPAAYANLQYSSVEATSLYGIVPFVGYNFSF